MADRGPYSEGAFQRFVSIKFGSPAFLTVEANVSPVDGFVGHRATNVTINGNFLDGESDITDGFPAVSLHYELSDKKKLREDLGIGPTTPLPPTLTFEITLICEITSSFKNNNFNYEVFGPDEFLDEFHTRAPDYPVGIEQSVFTITVEVDISKKIAVTSVSWN